MGDPQCGELVMSDTFESRGYSHSATAHLREVHALDVNSAKLDKIFWSWALLQYAARGNQAEHLLDGALDRASGHPLSRHFNEPRWSYARLASEYKSNWLASQLYENVNTCGADSTFLLWDEKRQTWMPLHKQSRELAADRKPADLIAERYRLLRDLTVYNQSGRVQAAWELSVTYQNGQKDTLSQFLLADFRSFHLEFLWHKVSEAVADGKIFNTAPGIAMFEAIIESDPGARMGFFNVDVAHTHGRRAWQMLRPVDSVLIELGSQAVLSTMPLGLMESDKGMRVFEKALWVASQIGQE